MIYSLLTIYEGQSLTEYKVPVVCSDFIYNNMPHTDDPWIVLAEKQGGYTYISEVKQAVEDALRYNPINIYTYRCNTASLNDTDQQRVIKAFKGTTETYNVGAAYAYPGEWLAANIVGYSYLAGNPQADSLPRATYGLWGAYIPAENAMFGDAFYNENDVPHNIVHVMYKTMAWPENLIKDKVYDFSSVRQAPNSRHYVCFITIDIWYDPTNNIFNATVSVQRKDYDLSHWIESLSDTDTGKIYDPDHPYDPNQDPDNEGGNGDEDDQDDNIPIPDIPDVDITESGVVTAFKLTPTNVGSIFEYLTSNSPLDVVTKWWGHPLDAIVSMHILPNNMLEKPGGAREFKLGGLSTGLVYGTVPQWQKIDLGNVTVKEYWKNALDYAPHTQASMYLPMIGYRDINVDDVMAKTVNLTYIIDTISGAATAFVSVKGPQDDKFTVRYTFTGSAASPIPIAHQDWGECLLSLATVASSSIGSGIAAGASAAAEGQTGVLGPVVAGVGAAATSAIGSVGQLQKPMISRSGSMSGSSCVMAVRKAYLILTRPIAAIPNYWQQVEGLPSGKGVSLGAISGYAAVESCHLHGITGTAAEIEEIDTLLRQGVIF